MAALDFQTSEETLDSYDPIPVGEYPAMIVQSDVVPTNDKTGMRMKLTWQILDGEYAGRFVYDSINLKNKSAKAEEIGRKQLNTLALACGKPSGTHIGDSVELHEIPVLIDVRIRPADGQYRESNDVKGYKPADGAAPAPAPAAAAARPPVAKSAAAAPAAKAPATATGKPAWFKKLSVPLSPGGG
jgi:hypothetical protein